MDEQGDQGTDTEMRIAESPTNREQRTGDPVGKVVSGVSIASEPLRVFAIGFLLAAAFFLVEAGAAEIVLARRSDCVEQLGRMRLAPNPEQACMSEFQFFLARAVSRGVFVSADPEPSGAIAWPLMAGLYGLMGGALARMKPTRGIGVYLGVHLALLMVLMSLDFLSRFIV
jgi:hypothetical protein